MSEDHQTEHKSEARDDDDYLFPFPEVLTEPQPDPDRVVMIEELTETEDHQVDDGALTPDGDDNLFPFPEVVTEPQPDPE